MANELEFSNLNGYKVKDAKARTMIEDMDEAKLSKDDFNNKMTETESHFESVEEDIESLNTRFDSFAEMVPDANNNMKAENITYSNTDSNLEATNIQAAIDETSSFLTASDGTRFKFSVNESGEYGYMVTDSEGADTFFPFSNAKKLYEALQYSGLVTEDMSFDEMCEVLAEEYPEILKILYTDLTSFSRYTGNAKPITFTGLDDIINMTINVDGVIAIAGARTEKINLSNFKKVNVEIKSISWGTTLNMSYEIFNIGFIDDATVVDESIPMEKTTTINISNPALYEIDVSDIEGERYLQLQMKTNIIGTKNIELTITLER